MLCQRVRALTASQLVDECPICHRPIVPQSEFCSLHLQAIKHLEEQYERWQAAYDGNLDRREYFERLLHLGETGTAVIDVIEYLGRTMAGRI